MTDFLSLFYEGDLIAAEWTMAEPEKVTHFLLREIGLFETLCGKYSPEFTEGERWIDFWDNKEHPVTCPACLALKPTEPTIAGIPVTKDPVVTNTAELLRTAPDPLRESEGVVNCIHQKRRIVGYARVGMGDVTVEWCPTCGAIKRTMTNWEYRLYPWEIPTELLEEKP